MPACGPAAAPRPSPPPIVTLVRRADFLATARARRQSRPGLTVQGRRREPGESDASIRVGYTCSKKVGNAVARNRAKRRLRAAARTVVPGDGRAGWDYVLIGRPGATASRPFVSLCDDIASALRALHAADGA